ncbi:ABC transporter ATP-binding protein [Anaerorhabdus sp.]|uniref:ABC transporter ATP-binding protein n=1 Tax=Anaerorhabdus sp. TaxID=1872524 RepID=UPI002FCB7B39
MFKLLLKYCKPYILSIIVILGLVFGQVQAELALPDYMSKIVTDGIQYGGIVSSAPDIMSEDTMNKVLLLSNDADKSIIQSSYTLITGEDETVLKDYPGVNVNRFYVLNKDDHSKVEAVIAKPLLLIRTLSSEEAIKKMNLPEGVDIWQAIQANPEMLAKMESKIEEGMASYSEENIQSAAKVMVKQEYQALGINTDSIQSNYIFKEGFLMLIIALIGAAFAIAGAFLSSKTAAKVARDTRKDVFTKVESFSSNEFGKFSTSSLITRTTNDIQQIQQVFTMMLRIVLYAPIMGVGALLKVIQYPSMLWILGLVIGVIMVVLITTFTFTLPKFKIIQKLVDRLNLVMREFLDGMLVIRAFNTQKHEEKRFDKANSDITRVNLFVNRTMASVMPAMQFIMSAVTILIVWVASKQIDIGAMNIGEMMAFLQYSMHVLMSFIMVSMIAIMLPRSAVSAVRISEVLATEPTIHDPKIAKPLPEKNASIQFKNVYFKYPKAEEYVLKDITFTANPGETIAFIGSTGSGKSTLINLLPRFFDVTEGEITYGDINIKDFTQHDLRERIGYVPQKGVLFSGDIESNLRYADQNASEEMINTAIEVSQSKEFVESKPEGLETPIAQGGTNVSGGQKQRLSIARAITKNPDIYVFDDSFSALDYKTDSKLRAALGELTAKTKSTVFIVAQRISTIINADKIIVLDQGNIVGIGSHHTLLKDCQVYQEIAYSQLSKEELEHGKQ